jgi:hypothetical protein
MVSCNFATHATYPLELTLYKYIELQMFFATQKLSCKANCKTPFFLMVNLVLCFVSNLDVIFTIFLVVKVLSICINHWMQFLAKFLQ